MSKVELSGFLTSISGAMGNAVFRKTKSKTILAQKPSAENRKPPTAAMKNHQDRFTRAAAFAQTKLKDVVMLKEYEKIASYSDTLTPYTAALRDFMVLPKIDSISTTLYKGKVGDKIVIKPVDYRKIRTMTVVIFRAEGSVLESGSAIQPEGELDWVYTTTQPNEPLTGTKISMLAIDRAGNEVTKEVTL